MSVQRSIHIDVELASVGQRNQIETWIGRLEVTRECGRVRIGKPTQSGFQSIAVDWDDLTEAVKMLDQEED